MGRVAVVAVLLPACVLLTVAPAQALANNPPPPRGSATEILAPRWRGDLDGMIKRRQIRILVPYSKTFYFIDRGVQRGLSYALGELIEQDLNKRLKTGIVRVRAVFVPVARGDFIPALLEGRGDIAMGNITITPGRLKQVDFTNATTHNVSEIVVTGPGAPAIDTVDGLAGREVYVRKSSSFYETIQKLNAELARAHKTPVRVRPAPENLETEDILEMVNAGLVKITIADDYVARFWQQIFTRLTLHPEVPIRTGDEIAWMLRKNSPRLKAALNTVIAHYPEGSPKRTEILQTYLKSTKWVKAATSERDIGRFVEAVDLFRKYGDRYDFAYLLLMAQGYQESALNQDARSPVGAIGIMQVMPSTGQAMQVGDIRQIEPNIHAGAKFLRGIMDEYYAHEAMTPLDRELFTFAAYNAGPARIAQLRQLAAKRRLDPNVWFNNVELIAAETIGRETVTYVSNIYKYYLAYQMIEEERAGREKTKDAIKKGARAGLGYRS